MRFIELPPALHTGKLSANVLSRPFVVYLYHTVLQAPHSCPLVTMIGPIIIVVVASFIITIINIIRIVTIQHKQCVVITFGGCLVDWVVGGCLVVG